MILNTKIIKLDINKKLYETISAKQGDTESRFLLFHIFDSSLPFDLTGKSVRVYGIKPDDKKIFNDLVINDAKKGYCTLELTNQILAIAGLVKLELVIYNGNKKLSSIPFVLNVISSLNSDDAVVSTNEFTALMNGLAALSEYDNYKNEIKEARGGQVNLNKRLDKFNEQLDNKANENEVVKKGQVDLNEMTERTLQAIQGGNGTNFELLSIPRDNSVSPKKTTFICEPYNANIITSEMILYDKRVDNNKPYLTYNSNGWVSLSLTEIESDTDYCFNYENSNLSITNIWLFAEDKTTVLGSRIDNASTFNSGSAKYFTFTNPTTTKDWSKLIVQKGTIASEINGYKMDGIKVPYLEEKIEKIKNEILNISLKAKSVTPEMTTFIEKGGNINIVSVSNITVNNRIDNVNPHLNYTYNGWFVSDFIELEPNTDYVFSYNNEKLSITNVWLFAEDKTTVLGSRIDNIFTFNSGTAKYIRFNNPMTNSEVTYDLSKLVLQKGKLPSDSNIKYTLSNDIKLPNNSDWVNEVSCIGDSHTGGHYDSNTTSYPEILQTLLGDSDLTVKNNGIGGETVPQIFLRMGAGAEILQPCTISKEFNAGDEITITDESGRTVNPGGKKIINEIECWTWWNNGKYVISHSAINEDIIIDRPTVIKSIVDDFELNNIKIILMGTNGQWRNIDELIDTHKKMIEHTDRYIIVSEPKILNASGTVPSREEYNQRMTMAFGKNYLNARDYIIKYGMDDLGLTKTEDDINRISQNLTPMSLMFDGTHYNNYGLTLLAQCIYRKGQELGYW